MVHVASIDEVAVLVLPARSQASQTISPLGVWERRRKGGRSEEEEGERQSRDR